MSESPVFRVLTDVVARLEGLQLSYALGGSTASGVWGQPRYTNDIDVNVALSPVGRTAFLDAFSTDYLVSESELDDALDSTDEYRMVQALHFQEAFKIDFFLVGDDPFGQSALRRAKLVELGPGACCRVQSPEDVLIFKLRWFEMGNRVSERQWNDVVQVLEVQAGHLDLDYLREWAERFHLLDLLEDALAESDGKEH